MDILIRILKMMIKQRGMATIALISIIVGAFLVGTVIEHYSQEIDSPLEEVAEDILEDFGIDHDFSKDKKEQLEKEKQVAKK